MKRTLKPVLGLVAGMTFFSISAREAASQAACPVTTSPTVFGATALQTDCTVGSTQCSTRSGTTFDTTANLLKLPGAAGNFQAPPGASVSAGVYFAAVGDFDRDGWDDFIGANDRDRLFIMRNQTITCGKTTCSTVPLPDPIANTDPWWNTLTNVRRARFATPTTAAGAMVPMRPGLGSGAAHTPLVTGDFNGDGWVDFIAVSATVDYANGDFPAAVRLFLNSRNNGTNVPRSELDMSCTSWPTAGTAICNTPNFPTFEAPRDARTGATLTAANATSSPTSATAPATHKPGDFGPTSHSSTNSISLDVDGDHDIDILYGHGSGTCPGSLCTVAGETFIAAIDVWMNQCNPTAPPTSWDGVSPWPCPAGVVPTFVKAATPFLPDPSGTYNTTTTFTSLGFDVAGADTPTFAFGDVTGDGKLDLALGSPGCCSQAANANRRLRIFRGAGATAAVQRLDTSAPIILSAATAPRGFGGGLTGVFVTDFSGDGRSDVVTGSDNFGYSGSPGGEVLYWRNSATASPFTIAPTTTVAAEGVVSQDFDMGFMLDYDNDPQRTKDMVFTDGNNSSSFYVFPNRATPATFAPCGEVASGTLPVSATAELIITGARLTANATVPAGTSITYFMSNEEPANWIPATSCLTAPTTDWCVTFPTVTGRAVRWRAVMDSNTADGAGVCTSTGSNTPSISSVNAQYVYTPSGQHYRAGVVVNDGITYTGSFTQPGERGHLYAINAGLSTTYWDAAEKLDAQATRNIYTSDTQSTSPTRLDFTLANAATLQSVLGAGSLTQAQNVISWILSARFGVGGATALSKLGSIVSSTPAVLSVPFRPNWYSYVTLADRALYDTFASSNASRIPLVIYGSKDGMVHAHYSIARNISDPRNGNEAWAFVPPTNAATMTTDYTNSLSGTLAISSFPDGSPTLLDWKKDSNTIATAAIINTGAGGISVTALDVTNTVPVISPTANSVSGPTPMFSVQPGTSLAGKASSKVGVARTKIGTVETYVMIAGTGPSGSCSVVASPGATTPITACPGRVVSGYNLASGELMWSFEMRCPLTSDITVFETDDAGEAGSPALDGFADRAVFADECGYVYKVNPAQNAVTAANPNGWISNTGLGSIAIPSSATSNNVARVALFSTIDSSGSLAASRPITGTIGARVDSTNDVVLYFGTGGLETYDPKLTNHFYAVYARNGAIRSKLVGTCKATTPVQCEKFYGGVVLTPDEAITQRTYDPLVGGGTCDYGKTIISAYSLNSGSTFTPTFTVDNGGTLAAVSGPLYGDAGALYFATLSGQVARIGTPRVAEAGGDSATGYTGGMASIGTETASPTKGFALMGWRVVL